METRRTIVPTREGYERWAEVYDSDGNPLVELEERHFPLMFPDVNGLLVADVGCGTGRQTFKLAARGASVVALDFSPAMVARAQAKGGAQTKGKTAQVYFVLADAVASIPLKRGVLDGAVCSLVLEHVEDLTSMLSQLRRVCKLNGFVLISDIHPKLAAAGAAANFIDTKTGQKVFPRGYRHEISDYVRAANDAGFRIGAMTEVSVDEEFVDVTPRAAKYLGWPMLLLFSLVAF
jgi:ubiquinone/menaquinone biosynthesis C-methylase UbiE